MSTKKCNKCSVKKPLTEYSKCKSNPDGHQYKCKQCFKEEHLKDPSIKRNYTKKYYTENKEYYLKKFKSYNKEYYNNNKEYFKEHNKNYDSSTYRSENIERFKWRDLLGNSLKRFNQSKNNSTYKLLGYTSYELKEHLEKQGIDWELHEIDHRIPLTWFKPKTPPHIVNDLRNLQPLTKEENVAKGNRFCSPTPSSYINEIKSYIKDKYLSELLYL